MHLPRRLAAPIACGALLLALLPHAGTALAARASALAPTATLAAPTPDPAASAPSFARGALARRPCTRANAGNQAFEEAITYCIYTKTTCKNETYVLKYDPILSPLIGACGLVLLRLY